MDGNSLNISQDLLEKLKELVPQAFSEEKLDMQKLQTLLGEAVNTDNERYQLSWAGKSEAYKVLQMPTTATLIPQPEQSVNWDESENIFIEGENLEVLKVLQKSYYGKIKMIYIDPPYNTGSDSFIYPDKFSETKEEYLKRIGEKDEEGYMMKEGLFRKNSKENGQFHSNWLNMMLPRLFLARNLLKDDGVIFVSIDDNEQSNLKMLMDEIFGEENFLGCITIVSNLKGRSDDKYFASAHNYLLAYSKGGFVTNGVPLPESYWDDYPEKSEDGRRYRLLGLRKRGSNSRREDRPNMYYPIYVDPKSSLVSLVKDDTYTEEVVPMLSDGTDGCWRWGKKNTDENLENLKAKMVGSENRWDIFQIDFAENDEGVKRIKPKTIWSGSEFSNESGTLETKKLLGKKVFETPKPTGLVKYLLEQSVKEGEIVLDFFAGSGTSAHAVLDLNEEDNINRRFICVQIPESCDTDSIAFKSGYKTIAEIAEARIKKVIQKIETERRGKLEFQAPQKLGFRKYTLSPSNFKIWRGDVVENEAELAKQMELFVTPQRANAQSENILWELLIKNGVSLTEKIQHVEVVEGAGIYHTSDKRFAFVLDKFTTEVQEKVLSLKPRTVICLDSLFQNQDMVKTNAQLKFEDNDITFKTV